MTYTKYSASGNDFVIFHTFEKKDYSSLAKRLCNRTEGIGADGLIVLIPHAQHDFEWLFYNSDGSNAAMCGNGTRACAHYAYSNGLAPQQMNFMTEAGKIYSEVDNDIVETQLTAPAVLKNPFFEDGFEWWLVDTTSCSTCSTKVRIRLPSDYSVIDGNAKTLYEDENDATWLASEDNLRLTNNFEIISISLNNQSIDNFFFSDLVFFKSLCRRDGNSITTTSRRY